MFQHDVKQFGLFLSEFKIVVVQVMMLAAHGDDVPFFRIVFRVCGAGKKMCRIDRFTATDTAPFRQGSLYFFHFSVKLVLPFARSF